MRPRHWRKLDRATVPPVRLFSDAEEERKENLAKKWEREWEGDLEREWEREKIAERKWERELED